MNITVVTPYEAANFGAYLQAYCLKYHLEKKGHDVSHLLLRDPTYIRNLYYTDRPISKRDMLMPWRFAKKKAFGERKFKLFSEDQKVFHTVRKEDNNADLYILGSDEIWNIKNIAFGLPVFWGIGLDPAISYAASLGKMEKEVFEKYPERIESMKNLHKIMVRDKRTAVFVKHYTGAEPEVVCDPTFLVPVMEYGKDYQDKYLEQNDCILIYAYNLDSNTKRAIQYYARQHDLKTVSCCFYHPWCDHQCECSPLQFSSLIRQCKAVVTTTFHGSIFSVLNHANFVSVPISPKTNQLLEQLEVNDRLLSADRVNGETLMSILDGPSIEYKEVEKKINVLRESSVYLLDESIAIATNTKK